MSDRSEQSLCRRAGTLIEPVARRGDCVEWRVEVNGEECLALAFDCLTPQLTSGREVLLNTTAGALSLGTGGLHFVIGPSDPTARDFSGREAGHLLKLRYTPLQHRLMFAEEEVSPWREAVKATESLGGIPVLAAELHSQAVVALHAARHVLPQGRLALVWLDSASLPAGLSRNLAVLKQAGVVNSVVTVGQAFGGDLEAVNVYSGLLVARAAALADVIVVAQGPGNVGTGTRYGFSGMALVEALHAAASLGGRPILTPRLSRSDSRSRHSGVSHHTLTHLSALHVPVEVPHQAGSRVLLETAMRDHPRHHYIAVDDPPAEAIEPIAAIESMGRSGREDPIFFAAAWCAGAYAAAAAKSSPGVVTTASSGTS